MIGAIFVGVYFYKRRHKFVENDKENGQTEVNPVNGFNNSGFIDDLQVMLKLKLGKVNSN